MKSRTGSAKNSRPRAEEGPAKNEILDQTGPGLAKTS